MAGGARSRCTLGALCSWLSPRPPAAVTTNRAPGRRVADRIGAPLLNESPALPPVEGPVRLLRSRDRTMPMTFGTLSPAILLPAIADTWNEDRRRAVLLHELAHVGRHDCLTQMLAAVASSSTGCIPACRGSRAACASSASWRATTACSPPAPGSRLCRPLLELAYTLGAGRAPALVVSMARPRQLEGRMLAVMDAARNRAVPGVRSQLAGLAVALTFHWPASSASARIDCRAAPCDAAPRRRLADDADRRRRRRLRPRQGPGSLDPPAGRRDSRRRGTWEIRAGRGPGPSNQADRRRFASGSTIAVDRLEGLSTAQLSGAGGPVKFSIRRDAGTFTFEGIARDGVAAGMFEFAPNPGFASELQKRGLERPTADEQYSLARDDVGFAYLDELTKQGYARPTIAQLVRAGQHGVRLDYLREMGGTDIAWDRWNR